MNLLALILIAIGLAMDAFAISITCGLAAQPHNKFKFLKVPLAFGGFQALMPLIGWLAGQTLQRFLANFDHWVAFGLLVFIGIRMIYEAFSKKECTNAIDPLNNHRLFGLSLATSIDALAVGITFAFLEINIVVPVIIIGVITFIISFTGIIIGKRIGHYLGKKVEVVGGIILIAIGFKILIEHLVA
ncbi:MAG TPA: manganese efflux pump MntP family protein [Candidatus Marinimicrobia bacterium]|nr:manganese efflux pump MntP family protein [Candidatus Neomarinimicrobiota bacterium]